MTAYKTALELKLRTFKVQGKGRFPLDMLRHDTCWPHTSSDSTAMDYDPRFDALEDRIVELASISEPTGARWSSFGWQLLYDDKFGAKASAKAKKERLIDTVNKLSTQSD